MLRMYDGEITHSTNSLRIFSGAQRKGQLTKNSKRDEDCLNLHYEYRTMFIDKETIMESYGIKNSRFYEMLKRAEELLEAK